MGARPARHAPKMAIRPGFAVLKAPDIPSVLVETAFISNPEEEARSLKRAAINAAPHVR